THVLVLEYRLEDLAIAIVASLGNASQRSPQQSKAPALRRPRFERSQAPSRQHVQSLSILDRGGVNVEGLRIRLNIPVRRFPGAQDDERAESNVGIPAPGRFLHEVAERTASTNEAIGRRLPHLRVLIG